MLADRHFGMILYEIDALDFQKRTTVLGSERVRAANSAGEWRGVPTAKPAYIANE